MATKRQTRPEKDSKGRWRLKGRFVAAPKPRKSRALTPEQKAVKAALKKADMVPASKPKRSPGIRKQKGGAVQLSVIVTGAKGRALDIGLLAINAISSAVTPILTITQQSAWNIQGNFINGPVDPRRIMPWIAQRADFDLGSEQNLKFSFGVILANGKWQRLSFQSQTIQNALSEYESNEEVFENEEEYQEAYHGKG
jgi:hypothetical protein